MDTDLPFVVAMAAAGVAVWTLWSLDTGRRIARWGRRRIRRVALLVLLLTAVVVVLAGA